VVVTLPSWASDSTTSKYYSYSYKTDEEMMAVAIYISARNVEEGTGGPFGCAIFERNIENGEAKLVSVGMNRVVPLGNSTLHGETVAIQMAEKKVGSFSLQLPHVDKNGHVSVRKFELFTSTEPCAMCLGAILWSGVARIVCGATKDQASAIGTVSFEHTHYP
jgi:tRNA(Arg) A34 adenosine deaminase TadA